MKNDMMLFKSDCIKTLHQLEDDSVDLIITDPPYNLGNFMRSRATNLKQMRKNFFGDAGWDDLEYDEWVYCMNSFFESANRVLKKGASMIVFMSLIKVESLIKLAESNNFYYKTTGIWHKTNPMPRNMNLHFINSVEGWVYFVKQTHTGVFNNNSLAMHDFVESSITPRNEKKFGAHPTQKPEKIIRHFVELLSHEGDTILDPFMGSGTTGVVSKKCNRNFIGVELDETYFDIALKRIADVSTDKTCHLKVVNG